jgi:hypothetical protein
LADVLYIYPDKKKKNSFEEKREEILRNGLQAAIGRNGLDSKPGIKLDPSMKNAPGMTSQDKIDEKYLRSLLEEEKKDYGNQDLFDVAKKIYEH